MKNISYITRFFFIIIFLSTFFYSISYGYTSNVHQYIIEQSYELLKYETGIGYIEYDEGIYCYDEDWDPAMIKGVIEEDAYDWIYHYHLVDPQINETFTEIAKNLLRQSVIVWIAGVEIPAMFPSCTHFWDADIGISNQSYLHGEMVGLSWSISVDNALTKANRFFYGFEGDDPYWSTSYINTRPIQDVFDYPYPIITYQYVFPEPYGINSLFQNGYTRLYDCIPPIPPGLKGDMITEPGETFSLSDLYRRHLSLKIFGRILHLLADMSVPAHAHNDEHAPRKLSLLDSWHTEYCDEYEGWLDSDGIDAGGFMSFEDNWYWNYANVLDQKGGYIDLTQEDNPLQFIMYTVNQVADFFASDDVDGDIDLPQGSNSILDVMYVELETLYPSNHPVRNAHEMNEQESALIRNTVFPLVIRATAGMLDLFARTNDLTPINYGILSGQISINGGSRRVEEAIIQAGDQITYPNSDGSYFLCLDEGTYDVKVVLPGYNIGLENDIFIEEGEHIENIDFILDYSGYTIVDKNGSGHFTTIQEGIDAAYNGETVVVLNGTYTGDGNTNLHWSNKHITVRGQIISNPENCIITNGERGFYLTDSNINNNDVITGLTIMNVGVERANGGGICCINGASPIIKNCIVSNCTVDNKNGADYSHYGGGIYCEGTTIIRNCTIRNNVGWNMQGGAGIGCRGNVLIEGCTIYDNYTAFDMDPQYAVAANAGAAIYVRPSTNGNPTIKNNSIYDNYCDSYGPGHAIFIEQGDEDEVPIILSGNLIYNNPPDEDYFDTPGIAISEIGKPIEICDNLIFKNQTRGSSVVEIKYDSYNGNPVGPYYLTFENNTIIDNLGNGLEIKNGDDAILRNNIIASNRYGYGIKWINGGSDLTVEYSLIHGNSSGHYNNSSIQGDNVLHTNPQLDSLYHQPIWNDSLFSPCIDTGDPNPIYNDADGTPADMGAIPTVSHDYFKDDYDGKEFDHIDWISFPVLNNTTTGWTNALDVLKRQYLIDDDIQTDDSLNYVEYDCSPKIYFESGSWHNDLGDFDSKQGYIFTLKDGCNHMPVQGISGTWMDPSTPIQLYAYTLNWVGCFLEEPMHILDALESIEGEWMFVNSEHWWLGEGFPVGEDWTANPGESYMIFVRNDCQLVWDDGSGSGSIEAFVKERTDYFTYTETVDYMAINIDTLFSDTTVTEIAVYDNEECLGATKVYDNKYPVQILAYTPESTKDGESELTFRIYHEGQKSAEIESVPYITYNKESQAFFSQPIFYKQNGCAQVQLNKDGSSIIQKLTLLQNYPNPVRTNMTTIRFMPEQNAQHTELNIYNIRGQLVQIIDCDGIISSGTKDVYYSITWDCRDRFGKDVKSGIYFYKLTSGEKSAIHKMLLMK